MPIASTRNILSTVVLTALAFSLVGCGIVKPTSGSLEKRTGDEIVVAGQFFHTGTPVVLWMDEGGYDAYRVEKRFKSYDESLWEVTKDDVDSPNRYSLRYKGEHFTPEQLEQIKSGGWPLDVLQDTVDQFVLHYDVCGTSRRCFSVLHDHRTLSVHFMLDIDGTIYQTLDLKERAWHAGKSNDRSVGIEIANMGAYKPDNMKVLDQWYETQDDGSVKLTLPESRGDGGIRHPDQVTGPIRPEPVVGTLNGREVKQYDLTTEQYEALIKLTAALTKVFPKIKNDYPRDENGDLIPGTLSDEQFAEFQGLIGHYHIKTSKIDPGPAFQWDYLVEEVEKEHQGWRFWRR
jgi:N-acetylmuramoyl-L-alanine amidase